MSSHRTPSLVSPVPTITQAPVTSSATSSVPPTVTSATSVTPPLAKMGIYSLFPPPPAPSMVPYASQSSSNPLASHTHISGQPFATPTPTDHETSHGKSSKSSGYPISMNPTSHQSSSSAYSTTSSMIPSTDQTVTGTLANLSHTLPDISQSKDFTRPYLQPYQHQQHQHQQQQYQYQNQQHSYQHQQQQYLANSRLPKPIFSHGSSSANSTSRYTASAPEPPSSTQIKPLYSYPSTPSLASHTHPSHSAANTHPANSLTNPLHSLTSANPQTTPTLNTTYPSQTQSTQGAAAYTPSTFPPSRPLLPNRNSLSSPTQSRHDDVYPVSLRASVGTATGPGSAFVSGTASGTGNTSTRTLQRSLSTTWPTSNFTVHPAPKHTQQTYPDVAIHHPDSLFTPSFPYTHPDHPRSYDAKDLTSHATHHTTNNPLDHDGSAHTQRSAQNTAPTSVHRASEGYARPSSANERRSSGATDPETVPSDQTTTPPPPPHSPSPSQTTTSSSCTIQDVTPEPPLDLTRLDVSRLPSKPLGEPLSAPPEGGEFESLEVLQKALLHYCTSVGYAIVTGRSKKTGNGMKKVLFVCDRSGRPPRIVSPELRKRKTTSRKCNCPFGFFVLQRPGYWTVRYRPNGAHLQHNHEPSISAVSHPAARKLDAKMVAHVKALKERGVSIPETIRILRAENPQVNVLRRDVYNARAAITRNGRDVADRYEAAARNPPLPLEEGGISSDHDHGSPSQGQTHSPGMYRSSWYSDPESPDTGQPPPDPLPTQNHSQAQNHNHMKPLPEQGQNYHPSHGHAHAHAHGPNNSYDHRHGQHPSDSHHTPRAASPHLRQKLLALEDEYAEFREKSSAELDRLRQEMGRLRHELTATTSTLHQYDRFIDLCNGRLRSPSQHSPV